MRTPEGQDRPLPQQVFGAFHQLMHSNRQLMLRRLAEQGAHPGQTFCLRELSRADGMTQRDLADRLGVKRPTVTVMVKKMEKTGLVERRTDAQDARFTRIYVTDAGRRMHEEARRQFEQMVADVIEPLSKGDQAELLRLLGLLNDNIRSALAEADPADDSTRESEGVSDAGSA